MTRGKSARANQPKAKSNQLPPGHPSGGSDCATSEVIAEASELVSRAALLLRSLGPEYEKIAWVLEDTIMYLGPGEVFFDFEGEFDEDRELQLKPLPRARSKTSEGATSCPSRKIS